MVSALKVGGRRLHELARAGVEVERAARPVTVQRFDVELAGVSRPGARHRRRVRFGDLCAEPGRRPRDAAWRGGATFATCAGLQWGSFSVDGAVTLEELEASPTSVGRRAGTGSRSPRNGKGCGGPLRLPWPSATGGCSPLTCSPLAVPAGPGRGRCLRRTAGCSPFTRHMGRGKRSRRLSWPEPAGPCACAGREPLGRYFSTLARSRLTLSQKFEGISS